MNNSESAEILGPSPDTDCVQCRIPILLFNDETPFMLLGNTNEVSVSFSASPHVVFVAFNLLLGGKQSTNCLVPHLLGGLILGC